MCISPLARTMRPKASPMSLEFVKKRVLAPASTWSETEDETSTDSSSSISADDIEEIQLITRPKSPTRVTYNPPRAFEDELNEAASNPQQTSLILTDFIERSTRHDIYALRDLLLQDDRHWETVRLDDRCYATNFRRWAYKKENINHHVQKLCLNKKIPLEYHAHMELNVDDMSLDSVLSLLAEIKKHPEVRRLDVVGHLTHKQEETLLRTITSLLRLQDRDWNAVNVYTGFAGDDYEAWRSIMEHYMGVFSQLYTQYNIPIDIRPCAVH